MANTEIKSCTCNHDYQDSKYGKGNRVFNDTKKAKTASSNTMRCTVCGKEK